MAVKKRKFNITAKRIFSKLTILALVFLFAFGPIAPVFAQSESIKLPRSPSIKVPIFIKNGEVTFKVSPAMKNAIYIKKVMILKRMEENGVENVGYIR